MNFFKSVSIVMAVVIIVLCVVIAIVSDHNNQPIKRQAADTQLAKVKAVGYPTSSVRTISSMYEIGDTISLGGAVDFVVIETEDTDPYTDDNLHRAFRDYQIEIIEDSIEVFDGSRLVGTFELKDETDLTEIINKDNQ